MWVRWVLEMCEMNVSFGYVGWEEPRCLVEEWMFVGECNENRQAIFSC